MKIENGKIIINLYDSLGQATGEERAALIDALACREEVITEVMNQVLDHYTSQGSHGRTYYGGNPDATLGIDGARMRIAKASSEVAEKEIQRLADALKRAQEAQNTGWKEYHELAALRRHA